MTSRGGTTVAEALIALLLLALFAHLAWTVTARHADAAFRVFRRGESLETARIAGWVLRRELRAGEAGEDWWSGPDTVALRAFRGMGLTCVQASAPGQLVVEPAAAREADASKDSVLVLWPDGSWRAHALAGVGASGPCGTGTEPTRSWFLDDTDGGGFVARFFERGSYHIVNAAFRYRRGAGGRQPLTARSLGPGSGWEPVAGGGRLVLEPAPDPAASWHSGQSVWVGWPPR